MVLQTHCLSPQLLAHIYVLSVTKPCQGRAGTDHQVTQQEERKIFIVHNIQGWFSLQPLGSCTSPCCSGECHPFVKVKINHYKQSPRGCSSLLVCSSTVFHSASPANISAQKKAWVNLDFLTASAKIGIICCCAAHVKEAISQDLLGTVLQQQQ